MGIQGLLQFTKNASRECHLRELSGTCVAVDAYCWLHKGCFSCAEQLVKGEKTNRYINYCMKLVNILVEHNIKPILVFDGLRLPSKKDTEKKRQENRKKYKALAKQYLREGKLKEARDCFTRCVDVTSLMALEVIRACRTLGVQYIVAPYEADAQLAYLNKQGIAQTIITEDSDLILFGCDRIFYKMDTTGHGILLEKDNLHRCSSIKANKYTFERFRWMCILSGCDYLPSLPGIGLAKACKFFTLTSSEDIRSVLKKLPSSLNMSKLSVDDEYVDGFIRAENTFLYQLAFDSKERKLVPNDPYPEGFDASSLHYAGPYFSDEKAYQIALGNIDVNTMENIDNYNPDLTCSVSLRSESTAWGNPLKSGCLKKDSPLRKSMGTKNKVITISADGWKSKSTKKVKSPKKRAHGLFMNEQKNDVGHLYDRPEKKVKVKVADRIDDFTTNDKKSNNPFKLKSKNSSPEKIVISRFFKPFDRTNVSLDEDSCERTIIESRKEEADCNSNHECLRSSNGFKWKSGNFKLEFSAKNDSDVLKQISPVDGSQDLSLSQNSLVNSSNSQENYEPLPHIPLTLFSIDSSKLSQNSTVVENSGDECSEPHKNGQIIQKPILDIHNASIKKSSRRPGLSKPRKKLNAVKVAKNQLTIQESLQRFCFKKDKKVIKTVTL